jgi:hypothetical protein
MRRASTHVALEPGLVALPRILARPAAIAAMPLADRLASDAVHACSAPRIVVWELAEVASRKRPILEQIEQERIHLRAYRFHGVECEGVAVPLIRVQAAHLRIAAVCEQLEPCFRLNARKEVVAHGIDRRGLRPRRAVPGGPWGLDPYHQELLTHANALRALRLGDFEKAWKGSGAPVEEEVKATLALRRRLVAARSAQLLGRKNVAREAAESAVFAAERLGAAPLLSDSYRLAANILGSPRLSSRAREIAQILGA